MEKKEILLKKIKLYFDSKIKCHIKIIPSGYRDGVIKSEVGEDNSFLLEDSRFPGKNKRILLEEVFDIDDYDR